VTDGLHVHEHQTDPGQRFYSGLDSICDHVCLMERHLAIDIDVHIHAQLRADVVGDDLVDAEDPGH
jgi:hypothetical protein